MTQNDIRERNMRGYLILMGRECQCEHKHHSQGCSSKAEWNVKTIYGTFRMCTECKTLWNQSCETEVSSVPLGD